jgi:hypothetical protein
MLVFRVGCTVFGLDQGCSKPFADDWVGDDDPEDEGECVRNQGRDEGEMRAADSGFGEVEGEVPAGESYEATREAEGSPAEGDSRRGQHESHKGDEVDVALSECADPRVVESDEVVDRWCDDLEELAVEVSAAIRPEPREYDRNCGEADDDEDGLLHSEVIGKRAAVTWSSEAGRG